MTISTRKKIITIPKKIEIEVSDQFEMSEYVPLPITPEEIKPVNSLLYSLVTVDQITRVNHSDIYDNLSEVEIPKKEIVPEIESQDNFNERLRELMAVRVNGESDISTPVVNNYIEAKNPMIPIAKHTRGMTKSKK